MKKILAALVCVYLGTLLLVGIKLFSNTGMSVGVIGGADGPTSILVSRSPFQLGFFFAQVAVVLLAAIVYYVTRRRRNSK
ncbi:hypothetical protein ACRQV7_14035 [Caproiciproducens sp. R2]|uniref:hypothetical protein n=1 Tax=Caproiciproducens sp. R2 TaxID=3435187 RepID=UPI0040338B29